MIPFGDRSDVVTAQLDHDPVPTVRPIGVMIVLFGHLGDLGHESEGGCEVGEAEFTAQTAVPFFPV